MRPSPPCARGKNPHNAIAAATPQHRAGLIMAALRISGRLPRRGRPHMFPAATLRETKKLCMTKHTQHLLCDTAGKLHNGQFYLQKVENRHIITVRCSESYCVCGSRPLTQGEKGGNLSRLPPESANTFVSYAQSISRNS